jgi:hypothetical protein
VRRSTSLQKPTALAPSYVTSVTSSLRHSVTGLSGEGGGTRTHDPRLKRPLLYQLSYAPTTATPRGLRCTCRTRAVVQKDPQPGSFFRHPKRFWHRARGLSPRRRRPSRRVQPCQRTISANAPNVKQMCNHYNQRLPFFALSPSPSTRHTRRPIAQTQPDGRIRLESGIRRRKCLVPVGCRDNRSSGLGGFQRLQRYSVFFANDSGDCNYRNGKNVRRSDGKN